MNSETLLTYRAHAVGILGAAFDAAQTHAGVEARARAVQCETLAVETLGRGVDSSDLRNALIALCDMLKLTPTALRSTAPGLRQLIIFGAVQQRLLTPLHAARLVEKLREGDGAATEQETHASELSLPVLVTQVSDAAPSLGGSVTEDAEAADLHAEEAGQAEEAEGAEEAAAAGGIEEAAPEDDVTLVGVTDTDDVTIAGADVANLDDLKEMWQACYADAVGGITTVATEELYADALREEQLQAKELTSRA
jgi:hypothetical protein